MPEQLKPVLEREMEVYAGFLEHTDYHVGRLIDAVEDLGILDDTLIYCIIGDNGASAEGTLNGAFNEMANFNGMAALETPEFMLSKVDEFGSPESYGVCLRRRRAGQGRQRHPVLRRQAVGAGRVAMTQAMIFSADETTDIGFESGTPVSPEYTTHGSKFTGKIHWVQLDVGVDDHDHFIDPEERLRIAIARQ